MTIDISDESYQAEVLESDIPVLLDFWADWCMPCKMIEPVMESLAQEYA
ncbi:MAG: thioredoxin, partial [Spirochaetaceae bacterium]